MTAGMTKCARRVVTLMCGVVMEVLTYNTVDNFSHAQFTVMLYHKKLPLYVVTREGQVAGVAFARLKRGRGFGYQGLARDADVLPTCRPARRRRMTPHRPRHPMYPWRYADIPPTAAYYACRRS